MAEDISSARQRMMDIRRASPTETRSATLRVKRHLPSANSSGLEDALGPGGELPSGGTPSVLMADQLCGSGSRAERVALVGLAASV